LERGWGCFERRIRLGELGKVGGRWGVEVLGKGVGR
jgi:hypothetical protein